MFKQVVLRIGLIGILAVMAGCVDLFSVPGFALSPDGSSIVFLSGHASLMGEESSGSAFDLARADLASGEVTILADGTEEVLITAFDINPVSGDVAYISTTDDGATSLMLIAPDGSSRELLGASAFSGASIGTMMKFSPDGGRLAYTLIQLPPGLPLETIEDDDELTPEIANQIKFVAYVLDLSSGQTTAISNPDTERANTVAWSPDSTRVAYNAWIDGNDDGTISTMPTSDFSGGASDTSRISVYNLSGGGATPVNDPDTNYAPVFLSNDRLAFVSVGAMVMGMAASGGVKAVDLNSGEVTSLYSPADGSLSGFAVSPDGSQVAWVEASEEASSGDEVTNPAAVYVAGVDFAEPRKVADLPLEMQLTDVPVWTRDGNAVLVSVTNLLATLPAQISMSFSMDMDSEGIEATAEADASSVGTIGQVVRVDPASGEVTTVFTGAMVNSSFFSSLFSLATSGSEMGGMFGGE